MTVLIKEIVSVTREGVAFKLTGPAMLERGFSARGADNWYVSWDKIGKALFGDQYSDATSVKELRAERCEADIENQPKPCPFCGGQPHATSSHQNHHGLDEGIVSCTSCGVMLRTYGGEQTAIAAWNKRA